ncbi:uncharacterized protein LOC105358627 isoform X4 [Oryzias latipes]|uniref:uncharacterized protein LOC105358627 isoform X4 n=1 Tax=Oryzias latipes TaxID=8090 RepID=UPI000CE16866|nr:uncharacterized protein LOC105358627 isoform X4 [Oryzias latipes]
MTTSLMDPLLIMPFLWGAVSCSFNWTSASVSEVSTTVELKERRWKTRKKLIKRRGLITATSSEKSPSPPTGLITVPVTVSRTMVCAGSCSSLCVRSFLFSLLSSLFWFTGFVRNQVFFKLLRQTLLKILKRYRTQEIGRDRLCNRMKMCAMLPWKYDIHH